MNVAFRDWGTKE